MKVKTIIVLGCAFSALAVTVMLWGGLVGHNDDQNWQIKQSVTGTVTPIDTAGYYGKWFAEVWTYPRSVQTFFSADVREGGEEDDSIRVTFNDGSTAFISTMIRWQTPVTKEGRTTFHRDFSANLVNAEDSIRAYLINVMKNTAPLMSASEHQSARKSEFDRLVNEQLLNGTFLTRKIEKALKDQFDENGQPITVFATEIVEDDNGNPVIAKSSPLNDYGIIVRQFSVTATDYDPQTLKQFAAKKESFLAAERSKAQREEQVQERLMIEERGKKEKAEVEAIALKEKAQAVIEAEKQKEVAELDAAKLLAVAQLDKQTAETKAAKQLEVAKLERESAAEQAAAMKLMADAKKYEIEQADGLSEEVKYTLNIQKETQIGIANALSKVKVPTIQMGGAGSTTEGNAGMNDQLMNLVLLKATGVIGDKGINVPSPESTSSK